MNNPGQAAVFARGPPPIGWPIWEAFRLAKLFFYYSTMNAGKSTSLLQAAYNYAERGMRTLLFTARLDDRAEGRIASRIGIDAHAERFDAETDFWERCSAAPPHCVLVDEAQFLSKEQVRQLARVVDEADVPVMCYGLRTDFRGELFLRQRGSARLGRHAFRTQDDLLVRPKGDDGRPGRRARRSRAGREPGRDRRQ